jgi:hypothetical protein
MRAPDGIASSLMYSTCGTARATATTTSTGRPLPAGGGAFCSMIGTSPAAAATRWKKAVTAGASVSVFGAMTINAAARCVCACHAIASVVLSSVAEPPTTSATRPRASFATRSDKRVRSSGVRLSYSLATPGNTTPSTPAPMT